MQMDKTLVEQLGEDWIRAITEGRLEQLEQLCQPTVLSKLLTPNNYVTYDTAASLVGKFQQWFGECSDFQIEESRVGMIGERLSIFYRFHLQELGGWYVVEQQVYASLQDSRIVSLQVLCSGFQPAAPRQVETIFKGDALLALQTSAVANESTCAVLTPAIKAKLRELSSGQVLEVRVDDPSARGDIEAWCRLSGNQLLAMSDGAGPELRFLIQKK